MTKSKRIKRGKRGGDGISTSSQSNSMTTQPSNGLMSWFTNAWNATKKTSEGLMNQAQGAISTSNTTPSTSSSTSSSTSPTTSPTTSSSISSSTSSSVPSTSSSLVPSTGSFTSTNIGGRKTRRRRRRRKGGGYGKVHGLSVAKPTYYLTGGKSRRK